jgi:hypothetical protein
MGYGGPCVLSSDCKGTSNDILVCKSGVCVFACNGDIDCDVPHGECCVEHSCVSGGACFPSGTGGASGSGGAGGAAGSAGAGGTGPACTANDQCDDGVFCNGFEQCVTGHCAPATDTPCSSHAACVKDTCDESTHACTHTVIGQNDGDGDGHLAIACGGDDCDDTDPNVFLGHAELCDGKDNDCNGEVDDHALLARGPVVSSASVGNGWGGAAKLGASDILYSIPQPCNTCGGTLSAELVSSSGTIGMPATVGGSVGNQISPIVPTSGPASSLTIWTSGGSVATALVSPALSPIAATLSPSAANDFDATWTGSAYFLGWSKLTGTWCGNNCTDLSFGFAFEDETGLVYNTGVINPPSGYYGYNTRTTRVASTGSTHALLFGATTGAIDAEVFVTIIGEDSTPIVPPVMISAPGAQSFPLAIAATADGFVAMYSVGAQAKLTAISAAGVVGTTVSCPAPDSLDVRGATDGKGAAFLYSQAGAVHFLYTIDLTRLDDSVAYIPPTPTGNDYLTFSGSPSGSPGAMNGHGGFIAGYWGATATKTSILHIGCLP